MSKTKMFLLYMVAILFLLVAIEGVLDRHFFLELMAILGLSVG